MSQQNETSQDATGNAEMTLYDDWRPALQVGHYRFLVQQTADLADKGQYHYYHDRAFAVRGPRFYLPQSDFLASFPPAGATGDYASFLPHLVLTKRALPWERRVWDQDPYIPWLALLVLDQQELIKAGGQDAFGECHPKDLQISSDQSTERTLKSSDKTVLLPRLDDDGDKDDAQTKVRYVDLRYETFKSLCPRPADLKRLAHLRKVDMTGKPQLDMNEPGWFSVLLANRFSQAGANTVLMVSLEGWETLITGWEPRIEDTKNLYVRLILFTSWGFVSNESGKNHTFGELTQDLDLACFRLKQDPLEQDPAELTKILAAGYVPVTYQPAGSDELVAWYRGPLSPLPPRRVDDGVELFHTADAALVVDPTTGMADVSYACAWQLGRLLGLASPLVAGGLRSFGDEKADAFRALADLEQFIEAYRDSFPQTGATTTASTPPSVALADDVLEWLGRLLALYPLPFHYLVADERLIPEESLRFFYLDTLWLEALLDGVLSINIHCAAELKGSADAREDLHQQVSDLVRQYRLRLQGKQPDATPGPSLWETPVTGFLLRSTLVSGWPGVEIEVYDKPEESSQMEILRFDHLGGDLLLCLVLGKLHHVTFKEPREGIRFGIDDESAVTLRSWKTNIGQNLTTTSSKSYTVLSGTKEETQAPQGERDSKLYGIKPRMEDITEEVPQDGGTSFRRPREKAPSGLLRGDAAAGVLDVAALFDNLKEILAPGDGDFGTGAFALQALVAPETARLVWGTVSQDGQGGQS